MNLKLIINRWLNIAQYWAMPPLCVLCGDVGAPAMDLCMACRADLPRNDPACSVCGIPLSSGEVCGACLQEPPPFARTRSVFRYHAPVTRLIQGFKFQRRLDMGRVLGTLMAQHLCSGEAPPELLLPVPLHRSRLAERGYNHALELARPIGRQLNIPIDATSCVRMRATEAQSLLSQAQRVKNVKGAFALQRPIGARHVAIIDDVMTSGNTVAELARVLRQGGVERVDVWVCARAAH